jgi:hypothetical protein
MLDAESRFVRSFFAQFTFLPDVPMTVVTECRKKGYAFVLLNRPFGGERIPPYARGALHRAEGERRPDTADVAALARREETRGKLSL